MKYSIFKSSLSLSLCISWIFVLFYLFPLFCVCVRVVVGFFINFFSVRSLKFCCWLLVCCCVTIVLRFKFNLMCIFFWCCFYAVKSVSRTYDMLWAKTNRINCALTPEHLHASMHPQLSQKQKSTVNNKQNV